ncbi:MAG: biotin/lipoyl-containing protein [Anaerolineales bacterium]|jgi:biotin carboxyl carrier protein
MALYSVTIEDREYQVDISGGQVTVNGERVNAKVVSLNRNGLQLLRHGKRVVEVFLSSQDHDTYQVLMFGGRRIVTRISDHAKARTQAGAAEQSSSTLLAPMHGLVVDVPIQAGQQVEHGQTLVVLESMKMQMQLRAPRNGKVDKINVQAGQEVQKGALLVQFEE